MSKKNRKNNIHELIVRGYCLVELKGYPLFMNSIVASVAPVAISQAPLWLPQLLSQVQAGFPSPAEDLGDSDIDPEEFHRAQAPCLP